MAYPFDEETAERLEAYGHDPHGIETIDEAEEILFRETGRAEEEALRELRSRHGNQGSSCLVPFVLGLAGLIAGIVSLVHLL